MQDRSRHFVAGFIPQRFAGAVCAGNKRKKNKHKFCLFLAEVELFYFYDQAKLTKSIYILWRRGLEVAQNSSGFAWHQSRLRCLQNLSLTLNIQNHQMSWPNLCIQYYKNCLFFLIETQNLLTNHDKFLKKMKSEENISFEIWISDVSIR